MKWIFLIKMRKVWLHDHSKHALAGGGWRNVSRYIRRNGNIRKIQYFVEKSQFNQNQYRINCRSQTISFKSILFFIYLFFFFLWYWCKKEIHRKGAFPKGLGWPLHCEKKKTREFYMGWVGVEGVSGCRF